MVLYCKTSPSQIAGNAPIHTCGRAVELSESSKQHEAVTTEFAAERARLNIVIALKMESSECFESERVKHNQVLQAEIAADNARMKDLMAKRRLFMHVV